MTLEEKANNVLKRLEGGLICPEHDEATIAHHVRQAVLAEFADWERELTEMFLTLMQK